MVFDPFGGGGITIDACKKWYRRYYVSNNKIPPEREGDMLEWDITKGLPDRLPAPKLTFLDPPYWKQREDVYKGVARAERRGGELIPEQFSRGGDRKSNSLEVRLKDYGITRIPHGGDRKSNSPEVTLKDYDKNFLF